MRDVVAIRWRKLAADVAGERGRIVALVVGLSVSVVAVGAVLGAYAILTREISASYLGTRPASATLEIEAGVDPALLARVRADAAVADAEPRAVIVARAHVGDDWRPLLLFVVDDFASLRLNTFTRESGAWPPPPGTMLIERSAAGMLGAHEGERVLVKTPHGEERPVSISGVVHDPGLAPAWQEREGYGYVTKETAVLLGEAGPAGNAPILDELRVLLRDQPSDAAVAEREAAALAARLQASAGGAVVHQLRVPPPKLHPHQRQMTVILTMMVIFAAMSLVLSAILVATSLSAMLARQVREIGVMKTLGATGAQVARLYIVLVALLGVSASLVAVPLAIFGARGFATAVSSMLNFDVASFAEPAWVFAVQIVAGVAVPVVVALVPVLRAARVTVRESLDRHGAVMIARSFATAGGVAGVIASAPRPVREVMRRPARLALTLALLAAGGAMFMAALDVKASWRATLEKIPATRFYDVDVRLHEAASPRLVEALRAVQGVRAVEAWGYSPAAFSRPGEIDVARTYPDRGHGSLQTLAPPPSTTLVRFPVLAGRWLTPADDADRVVVLNHGARAQRPGTKVGDTIPLSLDGVVVDVRVIGIVEEVGAAGVVYATKAVVDGAALGGERQGGGGGEVGDAGGGANAAVADRVGGDGGAGGSSGGGGANAAIADRVLRIAGDGSVSKSVLVRDVERVLAAEKARVDVVMPLEELRTAIGDHILILVNALSALAAIMAIVGVLGLATTVSVSVIERTREIGVMKTLGATPARVRRMIVAEAVAVAAASVILAVLASLPLAYLLDVVVGGLGFLVPLAFLVDAPGIAMWTVLVLAAAAVAAIVPAARAAALKPRDALASLA